MKTKLKLQDRSPATKYLRTHKKHILLICAAALLLFILIDISPYGGKNIQMYAKWIKCGHLPYQTALRFSGPLEYEKSSTFQLSQLGYPEYFCNETEAQQAGYSADPDRYSFPHLRQNDTER